MVGAILGDIAGSRFEFSRPKDFNWKTETLFSNDSTYTDDTVMSIATKYAVLNNYPYSSAYKMFGQRYPHAGYGAMFQEWLQHNRTIQSYGNGSAMRVSYIGEYFKTLEAVLDNARQSALCTHSHPEGIRGAQAIAEAVFLLRTGVVNKKELVKRIRKDFGYPLIKPLLLYKNKIDMTCRGSVPFAIQCFVESDNWESCIRNAYRIKCDTDTIGCISGALAEAYYHTTGFNEQELLKKYLIKPLMVGYSDHLLYDLAIKKENET